MKRLLIVVDYQNDFVTGSLGTPEAKLIHDNIVREIKDADYIFFTQDTHYENYLETKEGKLLPVLHCIDGTEGHEIHRFDELNRAVGNKLVDIFRKNTFAYEYLPHSIVSYLGDDVKEGNLEVRFVGICTDICVVSNAVIVNTAFPEANISVVADACAGLTPEKHNAALDVMKSIMINVIG